MFNRYTNYLKLFLGACLLVMSCTAWATNQVTAARVWPAQDYTRIALEATEPIRYQMLVLKNPDRLVLDIEDVELNSMVKSLSDKILSSDPYIQQVRVAKYKANVVRMVVDLKSEVKSNVFVLPPAGDYKYRLVLDIYPLQDSLMAMLDKHVEGEGKEAVEPQPKPVIEPLPPNAGEMEPAVEPEDAKAQKPAKSGMPEANTGTKPELKPDTKPVISEQKPVTDEEITNKEGRFITIAVDAGHGGEDPGARGANGSHEKDITLMIAKRLKKKLDAETQYRAILTRDGDYFIPLHGRVVKARKLKADLFVSIHADAFTNTSARGSSVFALSERGATSASARYLAKKENESDLIGGVSLDDKDPVLAKTLLDLSQTATINDSLKLGKAVLGHIGGVNKLHKNRVEQAGFAVLKSPDIPSILVETAFISNPEEERNLNDDAYQEKLVDAIVSGIKKYFAGNPALVARP